MGVPMAAAAGAVAALVLGAAYTFATNWVPFVYLNCLLTLGSGALVGVAVTWGARMGKIRNMPIALAVGGAAGVLAVYFAWVFDPMARFSDINQPIWDVQILWEYMKLGYEKGFWSIGHSGGAVTGVVLAGVWVVEAGLIIAASVFLVHALLRDKPFCEEMEQWTTTEHDAVQLSLVDDDAVDAKLQRLVHGDLDVLGEFYLGEDDDMAVLCLDLTTSPGCSVCNFLTVRCVRTVMNKKGKPSKSVDALLTNLQLTPEEVAMVRAAGVPRWAEALAPEVDAEAELERESQVQA